MTGQAEAEVPRVHRTGGTRRTHRALRNRRALTERSQSTRCTWNTQEPGGNPRAQTCARAPRAYGSPSTPAGRTTDCRRARRTAPSVTLSEWGHTESRMRIGLCQGSAHRPAAPASPSRSLRATPAPGSGSGPSPEPAALLTPGGHRGDTVPTIPVQRRPRPNLVSPIPDNSRLVKTPRSSENLKSARPHPDPAADHDGSRAAPSPPRSKEIHPMNLVLKSSLGAALAGALALALCPAASYASAPAASSSAHGSTTTTQGSTTQSSTTTLSTTSEEGTTDPAAPVRAATPPFPLPGQTTPPPPPCITQAMGWQCSGPVVP